jgi:hypothetical protein
MAVSRGSAKLTAKFDEAKLKRMIAELKKLNLNPDIIINGKPKPDIIKGTFSAKSNTRLSAGLKVLFAGLENARYKPVKLFPKGIPWPEEYLVDFEAVATGQ